jgi:ubiquinone/menaquinone biosynthesis C-methylase UbiE
MNKKQIIEQKLGIPPDYQYQALRSKLWIQKNWHKNKFFVINQLLQPKKNHHILDLGTGSGNFELLFAKKVKRITGVDYNDQALLFLKKTLMKKKIKNVNLVQSDIRKLPKKINNQKYDFIILIDVIEHIQIKDAAKLLKEIRPLIKKNGQLLIITPNYKSLWTSIEPVLDIFNAVPKLANEQHLAKFTSKNLSSILKKSGYKSIKSRSFNLFSFIFPTPLNNYFSNLEINKIGTHGCLLTTQARV